MKDKKYLKKYYNQSSVFLPIFGFSQQKKLRKAPKIKKDKKMITRSWNLIGSYGIKYIFIGSHFNYFNY